MPKQEPESYDLNMMMDRLKRRSDDSNGEEGELVTRSDGSQAIRVRKRKRRSEQPHKQREKRLHVIQMTVFLVVIVVALLGMGLVVVYVNSMPFRNQLIEKIARKTCSEVVLDQFRMNPSGANAESLELRWPAGNLIESAVFRMLSAKVAPLAFFGGSLSGQELEATSATITLRVPEPGAPRVGAGAAADEASVAFEQYGVKQLHVQMRVGDQRLLWLDQSEATFTAPKHEFTAQLLLKGGTLDVLRWQKMQVDRAMIRFPGDSLEIVNLRLNAPGDREGTLEFTGMVSPYALAKPSVLKVKLEAFPIEGLTGEKLGSLFSGRVDSQTDGDANELSLVFGDRPQANLEVRFRGTAARPLKVKDFPFLYGLSQTLRDEWFSQPEFLHDVHGRVVRDAGGVGLTDLDLADRQRMAIRGQLNMDSASNLSGQFEVGVSSGMITTAENKVLEVIFGPPRDGYRWLTLEIGGTASAPRDNFVELYSKAIEDLSSPQDAPASESSPDFEDLTRPR